MATILHQHSSDGPVAILGCVYGNVPALRACLADARSAGATLRIFLGDLTGMCGHSDEVVDLVRAACEVIIAGNHEQQAAIGSASCGCGHRDAEDERRSCAAHAFAMASLSDSRRAWMADLADSGVVDLPWGRILCCHGSPDRSNEFLYASTCDDARLTAWLDATGASVLACTHTGLPWVRGLPGARLPGARLPGDRIAVNCGAAGTPDHDGDAAVHYALLSRSSRGDPEVAIRRVAYDHTAWVEQILGEGADARMVETLRTGWKTYGLANLPEAERHRAAAARATSP